MLEISLQPTALRGKISETELFPGHLALVQHCPEPVFNQLPHSGTGFLDRSLGLAEKWISNINCGFHMGDPYRW